ncbi:MAG: toprim domain-containing protein, partial [Bdellovibrionales bacterium]|nr:toprim domain-containing protein [Oligoflexia bacterium]
FEEGREYLKKRGINSKTIEDFQIGVVGSQVDGAVQFLSNAKAPLELARQIQVIRPSTKTSGDYDFFRERLMFPLIDVRGRVCGFGGRILPSIDSKPSDHKLPKYLNSAESDLFLKSKFLYGLYQAKRAIREEDAVILVEGYFDTIALHQYGIANTVAPCGTSLTEDHLKTLSRLAKTIIVFFDQDEAGIGATVKSMELGLKNGMLLYGIPFQGKLDPDEFLLADPVGNLAKLREWIAAAYPLLDFSIDRLFRESADDVEKRTQAIKQATLWLTAYTDPVGRAVRVDALVKKWRIPEAALGTLARPPAQQQQNRSQYNQHPGNTRGYSPQAPQNGAPYSQQASAPQLAQGSDNRSAPPRRRGPVPLFERELLQFFVKFEIYGAKFLESRKQLPEKDTVSDLFEDKEVQAWIFELGQDPAGFSKLKMAPEVVLQSSISQELRSVILEGLLQEPDPQDGVRLQALLKHGVHKAWARFSHKLKAQMADADARQDMEKFKELSQQFLDLQRKLKEFEDSYVSG